MEAGFAMRCLLVVLAFSLLPSGPAAVAQAPGATDIVPFPEDAATRKPEDAAGQRFYTLETPLEIIAANPAAAAAVEKDIPGLLSDPHYAMIEGMGLKDIAALSKGELTPEMLARTQADLKSIPRNDSEACKRLRTESNALLGDRRLPVIRSDC